MDITTKIDARDEREEGKFYLPYNLKWIQTGEKRTSPTPLGKYLKFNDSMREWSEKHNIPLKTACVDGIIQVVFKSIDDLILFKMTWG